MRSLTKLSSATSMNIFMGSSHRDDRNLFFQNSNADASQFSVEKCVKLDLCYWRHSKRCQETDLHVLHLNQNC